MQVIPATAQALKRGRRHIHWWSNQQENKAATIKQQVEKATPKNPNTATVLTNRAHIKHKWKRPVCTQRTEQFPKHLLSTQFILLPLPSSFHHAFTNPFSESLGRSSFQWPRLPFLPTFNPFWAISSIRCKLLPCQARFQVRSNMTACPLDLAFLDWWILVENMWGKLTRWQYT